MLSGIYRRYRRYYSIQPDISTFYRKRIQVTLNIKIPLNQIRRALLQLDPAGVNLRRQGRLNRRTYHAQCPNKVHHLGEATILAIRLIGRARKYV